MIRMSVALVGLSLSAAVPAHATKARPASAPTRARAAAPDQQQQQRPRSPEATRVANWIAASGDNRSLPYIIIDKNAAAAQLFDAKGDLVGEGPVLIGRSVGDDATPGVGAKSLAEIGPAEKTTPAGRFLAKLGRAGGGHQVLWVDYATSVALHTIPVGNKEHRRARMLSPTIADNRITFGCINVPTAFYDKGVRPLFRKKGGYVYLLPDTKPLEAVFPFVRLQPIPDPALPDVDAARPGQN